MYRTPKFIRVTAYDPDDGSTRRAVIATETIQAIIEIQDGGPCQSVIIFKNADRDMKPMKITEDHQQILRNLLGAT